MATIQSSMQLYNAIETALKNGASVDNPMAVQDLMDTAIIKATGAKEHQIRERLRRLMDNKIIIKHTVAQSQSGDRRAREGYSWQAGKTVDDIADKLKVGQRDAKPNAEAIAAKEVELVVNGALIIVGRNPTTGRIRITIEG